MTSADPPPPVDLLEWRCVTDSKPKPGKPVLVVMQTPRPCVVLAQWAPARTLPLHHEAEGGDYDEDRDEYFAEEGWYQCYQVSGSLDDEPYWLITDEITHWMPLPVAPPRQEPPSHE